MSCNYNCYCQMAKSWFPQSIVWEAEKGATDKNDIVAKMVDFCHSNADKNMVDIYTGLEDMLYEETTHMLTLFDGTLVTLKLNDDFTWTAYGGNNKVQGTKIISGTITMLISLIKFDAIVQKKK